MGSRQLDEEAIFHVARQLDDLDLRSTYLDQVCAGDLGLRQRVEALLAIHEKEQVFLQSSPPGGEATADHAPVTERAGATIGRYRLMEQIGEGGMGVVFVAEQERPVRRKVALKIVKPGMDTKEVIARFEAERQALALMDHANIAKVLDAGSTESGRPYFVMELVRGIPITKYCDTNKLTIRERLQLFVQVCHAVQHAHQKGIIHRDLKPSNVLVALHDGEPVPKVIDFGVAKSLNARLTDRTVYTEHLQIVGTLLYMSPEQAELSGLDVDTRSDIYSLGVLLYELLTGTTPFRKQDLDQAAFDEQRRMIREQIPPRASVRISSLGETATTVAEHRKTDAVKLHQVVRGDLDWIVLKSLEKDRTRRYDSSSKFADDIKRYLDDEPVLARPPSLAYRFSKYARRNRAALVTGIVLAVALATATAASITAAIIARRSEDRARRSAEIAREEREKADQQREKAEAHWKDLQRYVDVLGTDPDTQRAIMDWAIHEVWSGDFEKANAAFEIAELANAPEEWRQMLRGQASLYQGRIAEAIPDLAEAAAKERQRQSSVTCRALLANACLLAGKFDQHVQCLKEFSSLTPKTAEECLFGAQTIMVEQPADALELVEKVPQEHRNRDLARVIRAHILWILSMDQREQKYAEESAAEMAAVRDKFPQNPYVLSIDVLANSTLLGFDHDEQRAQDTWRKADELAALHKSYPLAPIVRAWFLESMGKSEEAQSSWEDLTSIAGGFLNQPAAHYFRTRQHERAFEVLQGSEAATMCGLAMVMADQRDRLHEARTIFTELCKRPEPTHVVWMWGLRLGLYLGDLDRIRERCQRLLRSSDALAAPERDLLRFMVNETDVTELQLTNSVTSQHTLSQFHYLIAMKRLAQGRREEARGHLKSVLEKNIFTYGDIYWARAFLERMDQLGANWPDWLPPRGS